MCDRRIINSGNGSDWFAAAGLLLAGWIAIACLTLQVRPETDVIAVAFPPWWTSQQSFAAAASAEVAIVRVTAIPTLLIVRRDGERGLARLRQAGAWLAVDPQAIAACFTDISKDISS
jgi:hypothetical protein